MHTVSTTFPTIFSVPNPELASSEPIKVLMIDDQPIIGDCVQRMLQTERDINFHFCSEPQKAIETACILQPTVILQDLMTSGMDGLALVRQFRSTEATKDIPIIIFSGTTASNIKYRAFATGANDYIIKIPDKLEMVARIRHHSRAYLNLVERNRAYKALLESQNLLKLELDEAERYVRSLLPQKLATETLKTDWFFQTCTRLGGDAFGYHWVDDEHFAIYLLDVCGHGVGGALLSVSAINTIRMQSLTGVDFRDPSQVLRELNCVFDMDKQNQMYFTIWYGVFNKSTRILTYASGGHPPALLLSPSNGYLLSSLKTKGAIIGGMPGIEFPKASIEVPSKSYLYVFSDGAYEIDKKEGGMLSLEEFMKELSRLSATSDKKVEEIVNFCQKIQGAENFKDDFSLLEVTFS